ncbi:MULTISPECIES: efflux RND transporter periplasmic adaptor subunit [unclassified Caulobacter]|uniref:efflux RND transporter periplasmic adaptor subunit n=1 Tax=unclassified Caulobacter TaxID=2648921 RepID=UPI0006FA6C32|nr:MULTISPECIES: efflux RND transporter periplasmic adaptor subunit [unclassified Caulobacter]KQV57732.1 hemolysin secretion protein D [Caulobacter sp. Root342]KQV67305.1 hemolysin secretion protein D [Caulobacter sp. Root343]
MIRRHFFLVVALAAVVLMLVVGGLKLAFANKETKGAGGGGRATSVSQMVVGERPFTDRIEVLGVAKGRQSVTITSNTPELITAVHFTDGETVSRGQVLVELKADQENAGISEAKARLSQAERDYNRWKTLADKGIAPRATAEQYLSALEVARAAVGTAQAQKLDRVLRAPFAGRVGISDVAPGMLIAAGTPIVSLDDVSVIRVDFSVPDRYLATLRIGLPIAARPDALPGETFQGHIAQIDTRIDPATRAIKARAEFPNAGGRLKPGMLVKVAIDQGVRTAVAVPEAAVQFEGSQASVFRIAKGPKGMVARRTDVETGITADGFVEINSGLKKGDKIVADGLNRIQDGAPIGGGKGGKDGAKGEGKGHKGGDQGGAGRKAG